MVTRRQNTWLPALAAAALVSSASLAPATGEPLREAAEVQSLRPEEAAQRREVRLRGVVTFTWHRSTSEFTVQDETGAVLLPAVPLPPGFRVGALVEIEGRTEAGGFGPIVQPEVARVLGEAPLPQPLTTTYEELLTPRLHGRRVEVSGIVRGQRVNPELGLNWLALELATGGGRLTVNVTHEITGHPELIDARVKVRGVNLHASDPHHQAFFPMICAHTLADLEVIYPAPPKPFDQPVVPLNGLLRSADSTRTGHRVRVSGTVTLAKPDDGSFFLQDDTRGIEVFLREPPLAKLGESVDVIGFAEPGAFSPVLRDADWRPAGEANRDASPEPLPVSADSALRHDGRLVRTLGRLSEAIVSPDKTALMMETGESRFHAILPAGGDSPDIDPGSILQLTGVCRVLVGDWESMVTRRRPEGFSLLLRGAGDIAMVQPAPYWTAERIASISAVGLFVLAAGLILVWAKSRRRLREAGEAREAARIEFAAILNERGRMAREIHDTLAQGFAGISAQLEALADRLPQLPDAVRRHLDAARELVRESLGEARRTVWNLRAQSLEEHGLPDAIRQLGRKLTAGNEIEFHFEVEGEPRALSPDLENNLLRITQEAVTNAVRHSAARHVRARIRFEPASVSLEISDDGHGFDPDPEVENDPGQGGGFGLAGMRERADAMHGTIHIRSGAESGTRTELVVPTD